MADTQQPVTEGLSKGDAMLAFSRSTVAMVLTDPKQFDNPIVYVNDAFERMTGYSSKAAVGRNCRFLQGPQTDPADVATIRRAIERGDEVSVDIVNYTADGRQFLNRLVISPITDGEEITYFLGLQRDVGAAGKVTAGSAFERNLSELQHRVKNHLAMIVGLVRLQAREPAEKTTFSTLARRIESLQLLYEELSRAEFGYKSRTALNAYLGRVVSAISRLDGRAAVRVNVDIAALYVETETALRLGLILSEILTNSFQHAFAGRDEGLVEVRVSRLGSGGLRMQVTDNGVGLDEALTWPASNSLGGRIVSGLVDGLDGELQVLRNQTGTTVNLDVPAAVLELKQ